MSEIESTKETAGEPPKETPKASDTPKDPTIKKIYNIFGLMQIILMVTNIVVPFSILLISAFLPFLQYIHSTNVYSYFPFDINHYPWLVPDIITTFLFIGPSTSILFIIIGIVAYFNKADKVKKTYGKKFIIRGIVGIILTLIIYLALQTLVWVLTLPHFALTQPR